MNASVLFFGILPLLVFVITDTFAGVRVGVLAGVFFAFAELVYSLLIYKTVDELTVGTTVLLLVFGFLSYKSKKEIYVKIQPVVVGVLVGTLLIVMQLLGKPLLVMMMEKYQYMLPEEMRAIALQAEPMALMARVSGILGWGFLVHSFFVAYAAFRMSLWWWLAIRGVGLYVMMFACVLLVRLGYF